MVKSLDLTKLYTEKIKAVINNYKNAEQISSKLANFFGKLETPTFCLMPKIRKPDNPGDLTLVLPTVTQVEYLNSLITIYIK